MRTITLTRKQSQAIRVLRDKRTNQLLFGGAAGGAKSFLGCYWIIDNCLQMMGTRWLIGRKSLKSLKETTLNTFFDVCSLMGLEGGIDYKYNSQSGIIKFFNDSSIILKDLAFYPSDPNYDSLGSLEVTGAFIDECNQVQSRARNVVLSRIRYKLDEFDLLPKILMTCNPAKNWVYTEFYDPARKGTITEDRAFIQALVTDNPHISQHYIENLKKLDEVTRERLLRGNWDYDLDPTSLFEFEDILDSYSAYSIQSGLKSLTIDLAFSGSDKLVVCRWNGLRVEEIISFEKADGQQLVDFVRSQLREHGIRMSNVIYDADGVGNPFSGFLKGAKEFHNGGKVINKENYENLKTQCYYKLAEYFRENKIHVVANRDIQDQITKELRAICTRDHDKDGKLKIIRKEDIKRNIGHSPDYADALMMRMLFELEQNKGRKIWKKKPAKITRY